LISNVPLAAGNSGGVNLALGALAIDGGGIALAPTGINIDNQRSTGSAGQVKLTVQGATSIKADGGISAGTMASGDAGSINLKTGSLSIDGADVDGFTGIGALADYPASGAAGTVTVTVEGNTTIVNGGKVSADSFSAKSPGNVTLTAGSLVIEGGSADHDTKISASTYSSGSGGSVAVHAGSLLIDGGTATMFTGIGSEANPGSTGSAGTVSVTTNGSANLQNGGQISTSTFGPGQAGDVTVSAGTLLIDGGTTTRQTGISSEGSIGNAGTVSVTVNGQATLQSGGEISSATLGPGRAGDVTVSAGTLSILGDAQSPVNTEITSATYGAGNAGKVTVTAGSLLIDGGTALHVTGIDDAAEQGSSGDAGTISVSVSGAATLQNGGYITSNTLGRGRAGDVTVSAGTLSILGGGDQTLEETEISSDTFAAGNAGKVTVTAGSLLIDGGMSPYFVGISSDAGQGSRGAAGDVTVVTPSTGGVLVMHGGEISSQAYVDSEGQPGSVTVKTGQLQLDSDGLISIENSATVPKPTGIETTAINVSAQSIDMTGGLITARSSGNVDASAIIINYAQSMQLDPSTISTSSNDGNGGPIWISGSGLLRLDGSEVTTSVSGKNGNGGNINISVPLIVMDTAAIQANTAAQHASGGDIKIDAGAIIPSFQSFILGGTQQNFDSTLAGQNLVQAAAADGVSGTLDVTTPTLDIGSSLLALTGKPAAPTPLGRSPCGYTRGSSLSAAGRGGLPASASDPLGIGVDDADRATARSSPDRSINTDDLPVRMLVSYSTPPCQ